MFRLTRFAILVPIAAALAIPPPGNSAVQKQETLERWNHS